jgi:hypothetical protein
MVATRRLFGIISADIPRHMGVSRDGCLHNRHVGVQHTPLPLQATVFAPGDRAPRRSRHIRCWGHNAQDALVDSLSRAADKVVSAADWNGLGPSTDTQGSRKEEERRRVCGVGGRGLSSTARC